MAERVASFLRSTLGWEGAHQVAPMAGGTSRRASLLRYNNNQFVLHDRSPDASTWRPGLDTELLVWRAAADAGLAPQLLAADTESGLVLSEYVEAVPLGGEELAKAETWFRLEQLVAGLHRLPVRGISAYSPMCATRYYERALVSHRHPFAQLAELKALAAEFSFGQTVGHNDFVPANVLDDGERLWLIDFEFAGRSTPLLDFASLVAFGQAPPPSFTLAYSDGIMKRAVRLVRLLALAWLAVLEIRGGLNEELGRWKRRLIEDLEIES